MIRRLGRIVFLGCLVGAALLVTAPAVQAVREGPMRILLLVDSSSAMQNFLTQFRAGLHAFVDAIPEDAEVVIVSTGGQLRLRTPATADREKLHGVASGFAHDGGANSMLETMLEADRRFLKVATDRWPVIVILSTDNATNSPSESRIDAYNKFMNDFLQRGGIAEAFVIKGNQTGVVTDISMNLTSNTGGKYEPLAAPNALADRMKAAGERLTAEYKAMHQR
jgi:hypothetical protein